MRILIISEEAHEDEEKEEDSFPLKKEVRSNWFNAYPYHKFEERREEAGLLESLRNQDYKDRSSNFKM